MPLLDSGLTLEGYKATLRTLLPVLRSWERWSGEHAPAALQPLLAARRRSHLLEEDLCSLDVISSPSLASRAAKVTPTSGVTATGQARFGRRPRQPSPPCPRYTARR